MPDERLSPIAPICLVIGALLGLAGSFAPSASLRGLAWGVDGTALIEASGPSFAAGAALWSAALVLISAPNVMPIAVRLLGLFASVLFAVTAISAFAGRILTPLSEPFPFFAYPFLVLTMCGWAWWCRGARL